MIALDSALSYWDLTDDILTRFSITDRERTIIDAFRLRHHLGEDEAHRALRRYLLQSRPRLARPADLARQLRVSAPVRYALRVLQG